MPFRVVPNQADPRTVCPSCHGGILELVPGYRSKAHLVFKCKRCHAGVALPSKYAGRCRYWDELIEESEIAGYIGPRCQGCQFYNESMNPRLNPVNLRRCPHLDLTHIPTKSEFERHMGQSRDLDAEEGHKDALKRLSKLPQQDWIPP